MKKSIICVAIIFVTLSGFSQKPGKAVKNVILMVGDGMGVAQVYP